MVIVDLDQPSSLGAEDELTASPRVTRDQFCWPRIILQRDGLKCLVDSHLHGQVEQLGVPVLHPEPAEEPQDDLLAGGVRGYHDCLVCQVRSQTCCIHLDGGKNCLYFKPNFLIAIIRVYFPLVLPPTTVYPGLVPW